MMILKQKKPSSELMMTEFDSFLADKIEHVSFTGYSSFGFVCMVDIADSTKITATIGESKVSSYYTVFLNSMASIVKKYHGKIIKNMGDSLLYYFSETECKECIDCGIAMLESRQMICELLSRYDMPCLHYRVSADFGKLYHAQSLGAVSEDVFGTPVNVASKINKLASKDGFVLGGDLHQIAKSQTTYKFKIISDSVNILDKKYPVYQVILS